MASRSYEMFTQSLLVIMLLMVSMASTLPVRMERDSNAVACINAIQVDLQLSLDALFHKVVRFPCRVSQPV